MAVNPTYKRCGAAETEINVFLKCPFATRIWELVPSLFKPSVENIDSMGSLLIQCTKMISLPPSGLGATPLFPWVLWVLWINRNKLLFEDKSFTEQESVLKILQDARAWKAAQMSIEKPSLPQYAAWDSSTGNCGFGWLLRDANNFISERSSSHRRFVPSALVVEVLAVKAALSAALSSHVTSIRVCSDSKNLIRILKTHVQDVALKGILHYIKSMACSFTSISFIHVPRLANVKADLIAKAALFDLSSSGTL